MELIESTATGPLVTGILVGSLAAIAANLSFLGPLWRKMSTHPGSNLLLLNAAAAATLAASALGAAVSADLVAILRQEPARLCVSNRFCNLRSAPITVGLSVFDLSLLALGAQRALSAAAAWLRVRSEARRVRAATVSGRLFPPPPSAPTRVVGLAPGALLALSIWLAAALSALLRIASIRRPDYILGYCRLGEGNFRPVFTTSLILNSLAVLLYAVALKLSRSLLRLFRTAQLHFSLRERAELRYNIHVTRAIAPVVLYQCLCYLLGAGFLQLFLPSFLDQYSQHQAHQVRQDPNG